jgi:hypothetical protein
MDFIGKLETSDSGKEIHAAYKGIVAQYDDLGARLINIAGAANGDEYGRKASAVRLLGHLREARAVDVLVRQIMYCPRVTVAGEMQSWEGYYLAAVSLTKIGIPAVPSVMRRMREPSVEKNELQICAWVLREILGKDAALSMLSADVERYPKWWQHASKADTARSLIRDYRPSLSPPWGKADRSATSGE